MPTSSTSRSRLPAPRNRIANPPRCYACSWLRDVCSQVEDALEYLERVRTHVDTPQIYASFLEVMHNFKNRRVDTPGVIDRVLQLFRGDRDLILGFNQFLPPGYVIQFTQDAAAEPVLSPASSCSPCRRRGLHSGEAAAAAAAAAPVSAATRAAAAAATVQSADTVADAARRKRGRPLLTAGEIAARDAARDALLQALSAKPRTITELEMAIEIAEGAGLCEYNGEAHEEELKRARSALVEARSDAADESRLAELGIDEIAIPNEFLCPITREIMNEPVVASDGFTYEKSAVKTLLRQEAPESPLTREPLRRDVIPNFTMLKLIREHRQHALKLAEAGLAKGRAEVSGERKLRKRPRS